MEKVSMGAIKTSLLYSLFLVTLSFVLTIGCEKAKNRKPTTEQPVVEVETVGDTSEVEQKAKPVPSLERRAEVETRLESLLSLIEEREKILLDKEKRLFALEKRVEERAANLDKGEKNLRLQQTISWIVLALGAVGIGLAFVIGTRQRKKTAVKAKVGKPSKITGAKERPKTKVKPETKKATEETIQKTKK